MQPHNLPLLLLATLGTTYLQAQADSVMPSSAITAKYVKQVSSKTSQLGGKLHKSTSKLLANLEKKETRLQRKLAKKDSLKAAQVFGSSRQQYEQLHQKLDKTQGINQYIPSLDTLTTSLEFFNQNQNLLKKVKGASEDVRDALSKAGQLKSEFQKAEDVKKFIKERQQFLKSQLEALGMAKQLKAINKQVYYYSAQVNEYKDILKDSKKAERKALDLLSKSEIYTNFLRKNSQLVSLFPVPGNSNDPTGMANIAGLQTRTQVNALVQQQIASGGPNAQAQFSQNLQQAQSQLEQLKKKLSGLTEAGGELEMPEGFIPNRQKTKNFLQRIELGINVQSQKSNGYFPVTSDIAISAAYKLNDKSAIGIGTSYKMGWGENIRNIKITHQGIGLRSFIDIKMKGSFWLTAGYEMNYRDGFSRFAELRDRSAWQESGLIGLSKVLNTRSKILKKAKLQVLWDMLSYRSSPQVPPIIVRVGYSF